jgi:hypothetical protein
MDQERMKILKMVEERKITAEDAARLMDALEGGRPGGGETRSPAGDGLRRSLRFKVSDLESGRVKVNLCIPVGFAHILKSLIPPQEMERMEKRGLNINAILQAISGDRLGKVFDVDDEEHHARVEISIE